MVIRIIDWKQGKIEDVEVSEIRYVKNGIEYPFYIKSSGLTNYILVPYKNFLGVVK